MAINGIYYDLLSVNLQVGIEPTRYWLGSQ